MASIWICLNASLNSSDDYPCPIAKQRCNLKTKIISQNTVYKDEYHAANKQFLDFQLRSLVDTKPVELRESVIPLNLASSASLVSFLITGTPRLTQLFGGKNWPH